MSKIFLFLTLLCTCAFASVLKNTKQQKRGVISNDGWIGLSSLYGHGQSIERNSWKGLKLLEINPHAGLHLASASYRSGIALTPGIVKTVPVYLTKHVVLEKPVPVPEPVIIEKPYHVPLPIEKIVHKPVPIPVPVPQAVPIPVERPVPIPVKQPIAVPVQQPYPVPVKHPVPVPVPVPIPVPLQSLPPPLLPLIPFSDHPGAIYAHDYAPDHLHVHPSPVAVHLDHGIAPLAHGISHGIGHVLEHGYGHGYDCHDAHADRLVHGHDHKKRKTDRN
ncbi:PREDICTED: E3 ubiquitin-protein ligase RNF12-B-like [Trachymyrmex septentrionalis]|uniref:E3 ubiquitin-protein ligase RNF12-B-like n=1 Tax=Trachymyrmex septentrionalis TaxID=34720 RepID=UPI00084F6FAC|nr:PREDICTED: E3 ubiquitin-protein ligase RNF12-B-like [Trachymyrmex septentrionalis]